MISLKFLVASLAVVCIWSTLPTATQCDTSYYEKYYSARRFLPLKKTSLLQVNFTILLEDEQLQDFEKVALVGDLPSMGSWKAAGAIIMNKTNEYGKWQASMYVTANSSINYRYFIAAQDKRTSSVQVRRWESAMNSRSLNLSTTTVSQQDTFGRISKGGAKEIQRGWLNSGHIVQFKLFRNPLTLNESSGTAAQLQQLRIKLTPVDPQWRTAIVPSARAYSEYVRMEYGNSFLKAQPEFGVLYRENDILIFHTTLSDLNNVAYLLQIYVEDATNDLARVVGYQYVYPAEISGTEGELNVNLLSNTWMTTIGSLKLKYVVINPLPNATVDFRSSFVDYWRSNWTALEAGHRGLGKSLKETTNAAPILENSIASMIAAGDMGADIVEFDVQLTSDLIPIIYHDYSIYVCIESKTPTSKNDLTEVFIKDITYAQLKDLTTYQVVGTKIVEFPSHNSAINETNRIFPTFEDFLTKVNRSVGFDIEIKWPQLTSTGVWESIQTIDKNLYIDRILDVMMRYGCGRLSFFTSFDADVCSMLRYKQNMYPVMFLSSSKEAIYVDPRADTIFDTVNNAQAFDLAGIAPNAVFIKSNPVWIDVALQQKKKVFLWGSDLKDRQSVDWFIAQNPTGVIYDRMDLYLPANRTSAFALENDLPEFFQLQCVPVGQGSGGNATVTSILSNVNML